MPEYLAPGIYIEETSYRSKSIPGVFTDAGGFIELVGRAAAVLGLGVLVGVVAAMAADKARRRRRPRRPPTS